MPGDGPALLGMLDIELLSIIRIMYETIYNKTNSRKPLLWWWYDDVTVWSMFKHLQ